MNYPFLEETFTDDVSLHPDFASKTVEHLHVQGTFFDDYFSCGELQTCDHWIRHLFRKNLKGIDDDNITEGHIDMKNNCGIQIKFSDSSLEHFCASHLEMYPVLAEKALAVLVPFATTYLYEIGFSCLLCIKSKSRKRLDLLHDISKHTAPRH